MNEIDETQATVIRCAESRAFLAGNGIGDESVPSHSPDSVSLTLDSGECFVGDLQAQGVYVLRKQDLWGCRDEEICVAGHHAGCI